MTSSPGARVPAWCTATGARSSAPGAAPPCSCCTASGTTARPGPGSSTGWPSRYTVIAPDLLGHGDSDKPRGDYSIAAYANGMRDLLSVLDIERATVVGHSLGGGIALQFAYQFPERCERLALVGSGGLGPGTVRRAAGGHAARRRTGAHRADRRLRAAARWASRPSTGSGGPTGCSGCATWPRPATPCSRSRTSRPAGRSCAPCAAWPTPAARRSPRSTGSTSPTPSRCWSSGAAATRSSRPLHAETVRTLVPDRPRRGLPARRALAAPRRARPVLRRAAGLHGDHRARAARPRQLAARCSPRTSEGVVPAAQ